jgi:hypothetical protein
MRTKRPAPAHAREVQLLVERIARVIEGQSATAMLSSAHTILYRHLKARFRAGSYKAQSQPSRHQGQDSYIPVI